MARKRKTLGCLFYLALVLLVLVVFLFNHQRVQEVIEKTGFARLFQRSPDTPPEVVVAPLEPREELEAQPENPAGEKEPEKREVVVTVRKQPAANPAADKSTARKPETKARQSRLFFVSVTGEGQITMKGVIRSVDYVDAPLTATLQALLQGPTAAEVNQGLISLLSPETRLRSVAVKGETAYIDFNEAFRFNSLGKDGLNAQLKQVIYTATEFPTVQSVQILIEGRISQYLGPEGVAIGTPLNRNSLRP